jgi:hypothetical protein
MSKERRTRLNEVGFVWRILLTGPVAYRLKAPRHTPEEKLHSLHAEPYIARRFVGCAVQVQKAAVSFNSSWVSAPHVRFGSKADIHLPSADVRFTAVTVRAR